jgi:hypothetical protein
MVLILTAQPTLVLSELRGCRKPRKAMIKKAVFSYFNPDESFGNTCGFNRYEDFLFTTALSVYCASLHFKEVQFISSDWGLDVIKELKLPITSYSNKLNEMKKVSKYFWAYGKLLAYNEQAEPFVHLDNDVFLWDPLAPKILNARLCFQSHEEFNKTGYHYYELLRPSFDKAPIKPKSIVENPIYDFAYNCGICGGHDLDFFKEWIACSREYIFAPENQDVFFKKFKDVLIHQNLFHEQYFAASLIKKNGLRDQVKVINKDAIEAGNNYKRRYTHLWGTTKCDKGVSSMVKLKLLDTNRELFERVNDFRSIINSTYA